MSDCLEQLAVEEETSCESEGVKDLTEIKSDSYAVDEVVEIDDDEEDCVFTGLIKSSETEQRSKEKNLVSEHKNAVNKEKATQITNTKQILIPIDPFICLPDKITNSDQYAFTCSVPNCNSRINSKQHLLQHVAVHGLRYYCCDVCTYTTQYIPNLKLHLRSHPGVTLLRKHCHKCRQFSGPDRPIDCSHCLYIQNMPKTIITNVYRCPYCKYRFDSLCQMKIHMKSHDLTTTYFCNTCQKSYSTEASLKTHWRKKICRAGHHGD